MPGEMSRPPRSKLKSQEAALLAGELKKPTWESRNEGIHERVSFEDSIWGFDLAGGAFYKTPLRVTAVKSDSRAEKAGIRPGDKLLRINDIDTSTLTIQEAHEIIIESGIHLRIAVTAPEDEEDSYHCWEDPTESDYDSEEERRREEEKERKRRVHAKVSSYWSLQWPWVSKRRIIYRESNCFMVPSKYEEKHKGKFPEREILRTEKDVVLFSNQNEEKLKYKTGKTPPQSPITNGKSDKQPNFPNKSNDLDKIHKENGAVHNGFDKIEEEPDDVPIAKQNGNSDENILSNSNLDVINDNMDINNSEIINDIESSKEDGNDKVNQSKEVSNGNDDLTMEDDDRVIQEILDSNEISSSLDDEENMEEYTINDGSTNGINTEGAEEEQQLDVNKNIDTEISEEKT